MKLTFFNLTSRGQQIHLLQTIEGKEKTLLLVAIANFSFSFFMILEVFIFPFLGVFNILRLLWNLFCFFCGEEQIFSDHPIEVRKNILVLKIALDSPYSGATTNYLVDGLFNQYKARLVATWI